LRLALEPDTGALRWSARITTTIARILVVRDVVFIATRSDDNLASSVLMLDLATGAQRGAIDPGFVIQAALVRGDDIFFAGRMGALAIHSDGRVLWRVVSVITKKDAWNGDTRALVGQGAKGNEMWRTPQPNLGHATTLALGEIVAQADFDS
jgi:hypothetical protein